jgi:hypothetical protein
MKAIKAKKRMNAVAEWDENMGNAPGEEQCGIKHAGFSLGF